jgi:hypothetical protein
MVCRWAARGAVVMVATVLVMLSAIPPAVHAVEAGPTERPGSLTPSQLFGGRTLTPQEAQAACGPAAAVALGRAVGRAVSLDSAVAVAREIGWTPTYGMTGPWGQLQLLRRLGVPATLEVGVSVGKVAREVQAGRPVIIRTGGLSLSQPGHYFVAERYDAASGRFDLAQSALVLRSAAGKRWFTIQEIASLGTGTPTHALYLIPSAPPTGASVTAMNVRGAAPIGMLVVETGGPNARLRATPGLDGAIVTAVADGTQLVDAGAARTVAGRVWKQVSVSGTKAWIDSGLLK